MLPNIPSRPPLDDDHFPVVIIGGGINGVAIARECARAGACTLLAERHDFASGTTSRSTRIIHGGLRYLEHAEFGLVRESLEERDRLLAESPHLVRPLRFLLPLNGKGRHSALAVRTGLWLYRRMSHSSHNGGAARDRAQLERVLDQSSHWSLFDYEDAQCEFPERLVAEWAAQAASLGATIRNYTEALAIESHNGRVAGVRLRDHLTHAEYSVSCDWVVNATGPWVDGVCAASGLNTATPLIGGVRGSHIVLPPIPGMPHSAVYSEAADGRPFFLIPWNHQLLVGTTEVPQSADPDTAVPAPAELDYLLTSLGHLLPRANVSRNDILFIFSGVRPLPFSPGKEAAAITRRHIWHEHAADGMEGMLSLIGGKLTTAARVGRECARKLGLQVPEPVTAVVPPGVDFDAVREQHAARIAQVAAIPQASALAMLDWFGPRAAGIAQLAAAALEMKIPLCDHTNHIVAEAVYSAQHEFAITLADILLRRVPVALSACWSESCTWTAASRLGEALGWSEQRITTEREHFQQERARLLGGAAR
jgi:glycerol-3-phosphate dehydrogenase